MQRKAQGSLEYLIIVAATLAVAAVVVMFLSGAFGGTKADVSNCKAAAAQCNIKLATGTATCSECNAACLDPSGKDVMSGTLGPGGACLICKFGQPARIGAFSPQELTPDQSTVGLWHLNEPETEYSNDSAMVGHWHLNEGSGTTAADSSGSGNTGTLYSGPIWNSSGKFGNALTFDGVDDFVYMGFPANMNFNESTSYTLSAWIYLNGIGGTSTTQGIFGTVYRHAFGMLDTTRKIMFGMRNATAGFITYSTFIVPLQQWTHISVTHDATTKNVSLYVNGIYDNSVIHSLNYMTLSEGWAIARFTSILAGNGKFFNGTIDEVAAYNRTLTAEEIKVLAGAHVNDYSGNINHGTIYSATRNPSGKFNNALGFNGSSYCTVANTPSLNITSNFTIEAWFKSNKTGATQVIISKDNTGLGYNQNYLVRVSSTNKLNAEYGYGGWYYEINGNTNVADNNWHHGAFMWNGTHIRLFVDGREDATPVAAANPPVKSVAQAMIGQWVNVQYFNGLIDEVAIYNRAKPAAEIWVDANA